MRLLVTIELVETAQEQGSEMVCSGSGDGLSAGDAAGGNRGGVVAEDEFGSGRCEGWQTRDREVLVVQVGVI